MRAIDTNVLVRILVRDNPEQADAADAFMSEGVWASHLVLAEATWVLDAVYSRTPTQIADAVEILLHHNCLAIQEHHVVAAALNHFRARPTLGFSDCLIVESARAAGHTPLGTFDKDLARVTGTLNIKY